MSDYDMALLRIEHLEADTELIDGLRQALMEEQAANQGLRVENERLQGRLILAHDQRAAMQDEIEQLQQNYKMMSQSHARRDIENAKLRDEIAQLRTRYNMLDMAYRMQLDEVKRLRNEG